MLYCIERVEVTDNEWTVHLQLDLIKLKTKGKSLWCLNKTRLIFFDPKEQKDLEEYLHEYGDTYFVKLDNDKIIGCGGFHYRAEQNYREAFLGFL